MELKLLGEIFSALSGSMVAEDSLSSCHSLLVPLPPEPELDRVACNSIPHALCTQDRSY